MIPLHYQLFSITSTWPKINRKLFAVVTLPNMDSDSKPNGYIILCRTCSHCTDFDSDPYLLFLYRTGVRVRIQVRQCNEAIRVTRCNRTRCRRDSVYIVCPSFTGGRDGYPGDARGDAVGSRVLSLREGTARHGGRDVQVPRALHERPRHQVRTTQQTFFSCLIFVDYTKNKQVWPEAKVTLLSFNLIRSV